MQTVLGLVDPSTLGHTQTHEHLLSDLSRPGQLDQLQAGVRGRGSEPIRLDNYAWVRRHTNLHPDAMRLNSEADATAEMLLYRTSGGGCVVDATSIGIARDPLGLARVSRASGVQVVMGCGYYVAAYHPPEAAVLTEDQIAEQIERDLVEGADSTAIRSGIIGEIGLSWPVHPDEAKVLRAAGRAQARTGAALLIHPGRNPAAPIEAVRAATAAGGDPTRTIVSHIDRTLFTLEAMKELAAAGAYVEFDLFGQESSYYPLADIDMPNDAMRVNYLRDLIAAGYRDQLVIAQDICKKVNMTRYGGEGYTHILENVVPLMRRKGLSADDILTILVRNPARVLAFA